MKKYIVFTLPSVLKITDKQFQQETGVSAKEFNSWKDDFDDLDEELEDGVQNFLVDEYKFETVMFAFAEPFKTHGFTEIDDDSVPEEQIAIRHNTMTELMLIISEDGIELSDEREGIQLPGIYDFSEWQTVDKILTECTQNAKGNIDKYISFWKAAVPK